MNLDIYTFRDASKGLAPIEKVMGLGSLPQELRNNFLKSYRGLQLRGPVMEIIVKGGGDDEDGHQMNILLCDIVDKLETRGIKLIDPVDLVYCLNDLLQNDFIEVNGFCWVESKNVISSFVFPKDNKVGQKIQLIEAGK